MMFLSLLFRSGRPMLTGAVLTGCGIALVAIWALTRAGHDGAILVRYAILATLAGATLMTRAAYRKRRQPSAAPPGDQKPDASRRLTTDEGSMG
ncbi:MAG: hypothetical protein LBI49_04840 [Nocardiopsaceae bacterium]|jgi:DNA-binding transcriptional LysR family regulator|nr:hypothetical protein [Nocardiopsaceae bacterium]